MFSSRRRKWGLPWPWSPSGYRENILDFADSNLYEEQLKVAPDTPTRNRKQSAITAKLGVGHSITTKGRKETVLPAAGDFPRTHCPRRCMILLCWIQITYGARI